jgi:hypothetical protein
VIGVRSQADSSNRRFIRDSAFTLGFELPPSHYPQANVAVTVELRNGPDSAPDRMLSVMHHLYSDDAAPKEGAPRTTARAASIALSRVYPNPVTDDMIHVSFRQSIESDVRVEITDVLGRSLKSWLYGIIHVGDQSLPVDVSGLRTGQYFLRVHAGETTVVQGFSVAR